MVHDKTSHNFNEAIDLIKAENKKEDNIRLQRRLEEEERKATSGAQIPNPPLLELLPLSEFTPSNEKTQKQLKKERQKAQKEALKSKVSQTTAKAVVTKPIISVEKTNLTKMTRTQK